MEAELYRDMFSNEEKFWWFAARRRIVLELIRRYAPDARQLADLGCGSGYTLHAFAPFFQQVTGLDSSPEAIEFAKQRGIEVVKGSLPGEVPLKPDTFDVVLMMDVLEHLEEDKAGAMAGVNLVSPGGIIIATVPAHQWMWTCRDERHHHKRRYSKAQLGKLFHGLPLEKVLLSYFNSILFPLMALDRMISRITGRGEVGSDTVPPAGIINRAMEEAFALDRYMLGRIPIIWGGSVIAVYRKKQQPTTRKPTPAVL